MAFRTSSATGTCTLSTFRAAALPTGSSSKSSSGGSNLVLGTGKLRPASSNATPPACSDETLQPRIRTYPDRDSRRDEHLPGGDCPGFDGDAQPESGDARAGPHPRRQHLEPRGNAADRTQPAAA